MNPSRILVTALLLTGSAATAWASDVALEVREAHGDYSVRGGFTTAAPVSVAWAVLTDYEHIGRFVKSIKSSVVETRPDGSRVLRQEASGGFFPLRWSAHLALEVHEHGSRRIAFRDTLHREFVSYAGEWALAEDSTGTVVRYSLEADPRAAGPGVLVRGMMSHFARDLLTQVRDEMTRRSAGQPTE